MWKKIKSWIHANPKIYSPRPEPADFDVGKIIATIHFNNSTDTIIKEFEGGGVSVYIYSDWSKTWKAYYSTADEAYNEWKDGLHSIGFMRVGDKDYPISQIQCISIVRESKIITIS